MANATSANPPGLTKRQIFLRRLLSFVVLWSIILAALFSGNKTLSDTVFLVIMVLLAAAGLMEFYGLAKKRGLPCFDRCGLVAGVLLMVGTVFKLTGHLGLADSRTPASTTSRPAF